MRLTADRSGERADAMIARLMPELSRSQAQRLLEDGMVCMDGSPVKKSYRSREGDVLELTLPEVREPELQAQDIALDVIYEDNDLIVINKPKGLVVHPAPGHPDGTLVNALLHHCGDSLSGIGGERRPGIVHRIDKDTSGLLLIAKTPEAKTSLGLQFFEHTTQRTYQALVWGTFREQQGTVTGALARDNSDRTKYRIWSLEDNPDAKPAVTHWQVIETFPYVTLVECRLETGRTHQIRVHMQSLGHPLFADEKYGGTEILKGLPTQKYKQFIHNCFDLCPRQALHAKTLGFTHPRTGEPMFFDSNLPEDMSNLLNKWRNYGNNTQTDTLG